MSGEKRTKINAVLARFEETIEQNNAVGVCSGMYLTTQVSKTGPSRTPSSRRYSTAMGANDSEPKMQRRMSTADVKPGVYREMLSGKPKQSTSVPKEGDDDWDPFGNSEGNLDFPDNDFSNCSDDDEEDGSLTSEHRKTMLRRPKSKGSAGRRGLRKTRTKGAASTRRKPEATASVDTCTTKPESDSEPNNEDDDSDNDSAFSLTYVGDREKYATLQRQSSDKRLGASSSRLTRGVGGLEMTRQDSSSSLTRQRKSRGSRSKTLHPKAEEDSSFSESFSESSAASPTKHRGHHHHHHHHSSSSRLGHESSSKHRPRSHHHGSSRSHLSAADPETRSSPQRRTTSSRTTGGRSTRNFAKSRTPS